LRVSDLDASQIASRLRRGELLLRVSPFVARIRSEMGAVARGISLLYGDFSVLEPNDFADFHIALAAPVGLRRWVRPQVMFYLDGFAPFKPLPASQAYPMFEWGLNWCIASQTHGYLVIHAAVVEGGGRAAILPAPPGSGKSTLCAGLISRGWRLLSDELLLLDLASGLIQPLARPVNLKNESIDVIRGFHANAVMTDAVRDTAKGTVALMRPPADSVSRAAEPALPAWVIFPRYVAGAPAVLEPKSKAQTFMRVVEQAFNYDILGARGFEAAAGLIDRCECFEFSYGDLDEAVATFASLASA
jgi:HprK-related kinase A